MSQQQQQSHIHPALSHAQLRPLHVQLQIVVHAVSRHPNIFRKNVPIQVNAEQHIYLYRMIIKLSNQIIITFF